jgi:hypothetical protein
MEKKLKEDDKIRAIKKSGREFFMEVVSQLCFGERAAPEPDLIIMLLNTVFIRNTDSTQELTPYKNDKVDRVVTIRSFLLQLLLEHRYHDVYLDRASSMIFLHTYMYTAWIK